MNGLEMGNTMIKIGQKVSFVPHFLEGEKYNWRDPNPEPVVGTVFYVNEKRGTFWVQWECDGVPLRQGFKFCDIGKRVQIEEVMKNGTSSETT